MSIAPRELGKEINNKPMVQTRRYIGSVVSRILKNQADVEDVTQDALLVIARKGDSFRGDSLFTSWVYRVAVNAALMFIRKNKRRVVCTNGGEEVMANVPEPCSLDRRIEQREQLRFTLTALGSLDDRYIDVFLLRFIEGLSEEETAKELGISVATVKSRAWRTRKVLEEKTL